MIGRPPRSPLFPYTPLSRSRIIMHRQHDAGDDLDRQENPGGEAEVPEIIEVARHRITAANGAISQARKRQTLVEPLHHRVLRSEEHTSELQSQSNLVCRLLL